MAASPLKIIVKGITLCGFEQEVTDDGRCERCDLPLRHGAHLVRYGTRAAVHRLCERCAGWMRKAYGLAKEMSDEH